MMRLRKPLIPLRCLGPAFLTVTLVTSGALAQSGRQPLVLVHGFFAGGDDWGGTKQYFEQSFYSQAFSWTLGWDQRISVQKNSLLSHMSDIFLPDTTILIAHSLGALTARDASRDRPVKGILTVGSPHNGAPIAASVRNGEVGVGGDLIAWRAGMAYADYDLPGESSTAVCFGDEEFCDPELFLAKEAAINASALGALVMAVGTSFATQSGFNDGGSLADIAPGDALVSSLNSESNLDRESAAMGSNRVALASRYNGWAARIWAVAKPEYAAALTVFQDYTVSELLFAAYYYQYYSELEDPYYWEKSAYWQDWLFASAALGALDEAWCFWTGTVPSSGVGCDDGDGLFGLTTQHWNGPGVVNDQIVGPGHTQEKQSQAFRERAYFYLANRFHVQTSAPATALYASITGPYPTEPGSYTFTAVASGGIGAFTYSWQVSFDGMNFYDTGITDSQYALYVDYGLSMWLRVIVTSGSAQATADHYVSGPCADGGVLIC